jgi:hypothetical protein
VFGIHDWTIGVVPGDGVAEALRLSPWPEASPEAAADGIYEGAVQVIAQVVSEDINANGGHDLKKIGAMPDGGECDRVEELVRGHPRYRRLVEAGHGSSEAFQSLVVPDKVTGVLRATGPEVRLTWQVDSREPCGWRNSILSIRVCSCTCC